MDWRQLLFSKYEYLDFSRRRYVGPSPSCYSEYMSFRTLWQIQDNISIAINYTKAKYVPNMCPKVIGM